MQRYFIELSYNGKAYCGWQRQPNAISVQQVIEESLSKILRQNTTIAGCGRTDTGVNASFYIAHFESDALRLEHPDFLYHLNCLLPSDIAIARIYPCDMHARFDARYREYQYYIERRKNPFATDFAWLITMPLDIEAMRRASAKLFEVEDFTSLSRTGSDNKTAICSIFKADWEVSEKRYTFTIGANRFLRGMVRATVGTIVDVGRGKLSPEQFADILRARDRRRASSAAPAQGLFLTDIKYKTE